MLINKLKYATVLVTMLVCFGKLQAQSAAYAQVSATILQPVSNEKLEDLYIGDIKPTTRTGSITVNPTSIRTIKSGIKSTGHENSARAASVEISHGNYAFSVTSFKDCIKLKSNSGNEMMEMGLITYSLPTILHVDATTSIIRVGGTLLVNSKQAPGVYSENEDLNFAINYN